MPATRSTSDRQASRWIFGPATDAALIFATPLLILPLAFVFLQRWSDGALILIVGAFGQLGHCLPGLICAYGDRELFRRYRTRFVVAPIALGAACVMAIMWNLDILILVGVSWAIWHALMQTFGFLRIYDVCAEVRSTYARHLQFAMCVAWFLGAILLNDRPLSLLLNRWYGSGGFLLPASLISGVRTVWLIGLVAVTVLYVIDTIQRWIRGTAISLPAIMMLSSSVGFYWYAYSAATNILVGAAMFEVFHDVQYLAIVWMFNRRRVDQKANVGSLVRFVFRRSGALVGVYVGLVFAFGGLRFVENMLPATTTRDLLAAMLAMAGLLHYYYDGFIWKVRDPSTRESLGIKTSNVPTRRFNVPALVHGLKWAAGVLPVIWLTTFESVTQPTELNCWISVRRSMPHFTPVQTEVERLLRIDNRQSDPTSLLRSELRKDPDNLGFREQLAILLVSMDRFEEALDQCHDVLRRDPDRISALLLTSRVLIRSDRANEAEPHLRRAINIAPDSPEVLTSMGIVLAVTERFDEARDYFETSLGLNDNAFTRFNLANVLTRCGEIERAREHYQRVLELEPEFQPARDKLDQLSQSASASAIRR